MPAAPQGGMPPMKGNLLEDLAKGADSDEAFMAEGANFDKDVDAYAYVDWKGNEVATSSGAGHSEPLGVYGVLEDVVGQAQILITMCRRSS